jgi:hypothetical protein
MYFKTGQQVEGRFTNGKLSTSVIDANKCVTIKNDTKQHTASDSGIFYEDEKQFNIQATPTLTPTPSSDSKKFATASQGKYLFHVYLSLVNKW